MTNTKTLKELIVQSGLKCIYIAEQLGISRYSLQKKIENKSEFKVSEVNALCNLLKINSLEQKEEIFFK